MNRLAVASGVAAVLYALAPVAQADEPDPCAFQYKELMEAVGTPGYAETKEHWDKCSAAAAAQKKQHYIDTAATWATSHDPLSSGGWGLLQVTADGTMAIFGSRRHETRDGNVVALWFRYEYRDSQSNGQTSYRSLVQRKMYDCARMASKSVSETLYGESNLGSLSSSNAWEPAKIQWVPVIPGTLGDYELDWACKTGPRAQPTKPQ